MFNSPVLEIIIGLFAVYLGLSALVTTLNEHFATLLRLRAQDLEKGVSWLLHCNDLAKLNSEVDVFYKHPLIESLSSESGKPSYIPSETFVQAVLDRCAPVASGGLRTITEIQ